MKVKTPRRDFFFILHLYSIFCVPALCFQLPAPESLLLLQCLQTPSTTTFSTISCIVIYQFFLLLFSQLYTFFSIFFLIFSILYIFFLAIFVAKLSNITVKLKQKQQQKKEAQAMHLLHGDDSHNYKRKIQSCNFLKKLFVIGQERIVLSGFGKFVFLSDIDCFWALGNLNFFKLIFYIFLQVKCEECEIQICFWNL